jgi:hypothetical protein
LGAWGCWARRLVGARPELLLLLLLGLRLADDRQRRHQRGGPAEHAVGGDACDSAALGLALCSAHVGDAFAITLFSFLLQACAFGLATRLASVNRGTPMERRARFIPVHRRQMGRNFGLQRPGRPRHHPRPPPAEGQSAKLCRASLDCGIPRDCGSH